MARTPRQPAGKPAPRKTAKSRKTTKPPVSADKPVPAKRPRRQPPRCNSLEGKRWLQNSISIWSDLRKTPEEARLGHPAAFPLALAQRLIETFLPDGPSVILDPFSGIGTTLLAAERSGKQAIGLELSPEYVAVTLKRLARLAITGNSAEALASAGHAVLYNASATDLHEFVSPETVDLCITSPPYWNILQQRRTADGKAVRHYGNHPQDLGAIADYDEFLAALAEVFRGVYAVLKPRAYCCVVVMDLRKRDQFYPLHSDLASRLVTLGYTFDDLIIWNRQAEYNNLRPLGYPSVFRVNKVHEYVLLLQKR